MGGFVLPTYNLGLFYGKLQSNEFVPYDASWPMISSHDDSAAKIIGAFGCDGTCSYSIWLKHGMALSAVGLTQNRRTSGPNTSNSLGRSCRMNRGLRKSAHSNSSWIRLRQRKIVLKPSIGGRVILLKRLRAQRRASPSSALPIVAGERRLACGGTSMRQSYRFSRKIRST